MTTDFLTQRRIALEEAFFARHNEGLRLRLREQDAVAARRQALSAASGITDPGVLDKLESLSIRSDTVAALALAPMVLVAWADSRVDPLERQVALAKAAQDGLGQDNAAAGFALDLFKQWLTVRPPANLLEVWKQYASAVAARMSDPARQVFRAHIIEQARAVIDAGGGFSRAVAHFAPLEHHVLREIETAIPA